MFRRMMFFMMVNVLIITTLTVVMSFLGIGSYVTEYGLNYGSLALICLVWGMGGAFISLQISRWMAKKMMRVRVITPDKARGSERALMERVHAICNKAEMKVMPQVGIYDSPEVNAFATGPSRNRSLVAVSSGLLSRMNNDQVEGVLAHEVAHITNGDMVTMTLLQGVINAIVMFLARVIAYAITANAREEGRVFMQFMVVIVLQIGLSFLGMIVVCWFSRWREYHADAGGARLAGKGKMVAALQGLQSTIAMASAGKEHASLNTLKISSRPKGMMALFATHPPLENRIKALQELSI